MKKVILFLISYLFAVSCSEPITPTKLQFENIIGLKVQITGVTKFPKLYCQYWCIPDSIGIIADSLVKVNDTLKFSEIDYYASGKVIKHSDGTLSMEIIVTQSKWRYWYNYNVPKWSDGYYNEETNYSRLFFEFKENEFKENYEFNNTALIADSMLHFSYYQSSTYPGGKNLISQVTDSAIVKVSFITK